MWNVFKFFFVWFWLGLVAFIVVPLIAPKPETRILQTPGKHVTGPREVPDSVMGLFLGFSMCIPAYFISRPKRAELREYR